MRTRMTALNEAEGCIGATVRSAAPGHIRGNYALPVRVTLCDVGPRDGLQNEPETLAPGVRAELVSRLAGAGLPRVEAVSFVRDERVPQMAGAEEVVARIQRRPGVELVGLVLNERGWERFAASGLDRVNVTFGATESFNRANGNASLEEAAARAEAIVAAAGVPATVTISVCFGCPFEGPVDPGRVTELAARFAGRAEVVLADTIGVATPSAVRALVGQAGAEGFHGHNTRNTGYANCLAALDAGARLLDASVGGLGGCPYAPRATGNVATEDLVYLLEGEGVETGVDLDALVATSQWLEGVLGRRLEGYVYRAGPFPPASRTTPSAASADTSASE
jgi:hydroxymethylglutaryl-CoA lyase/(R)-citramalyl-CoA lyase